MLLFWLWDAQLINYFTVPLQKLPFNNLEEFLAKSNKKVNNKIMRNITWTHIENLKLIEMALIQVKVPVVIDVAKIIEEDDSRTLPNIKPRKWE